MWSRGRPRGSACGCCGHCAPRTPPGCCTGTSNPATSLLGEDGRILLTDFGIAQIEGDTTITRTGEVVGSVDYLAPERVRGHDPGPASDLWALGATLYTAVEGRSPFRRTSPLSTMQAVVEENADEPRHAGPLAPVIAALLRKDPAGRPGAEEAEQMLAEAAEGPPAARSRGVRPDAGFGCAHAHGPRFGRYGHTRPRRRHRARRPRLRFRHTGHRLRLRRAGRGVRLRFRHTGDGPRLRPWLRRLGLRVRRLGLRVRLRARLRVRLGVRLGVRLRGGRLRPRRPRRCRSFRDRADRGGADGRPVGGRWAGARPAPAPAAHPRPGRRRRGGARRRRSGGDPAVGPAGRRAGRRDEPGAGARRPRSGRCRGHDPGRLADVPRPLGFSLSLPKGWKRTVFSNKGGLQQIDYSPDNGKHFVRIAIDASPDFADPSPTRRTWNSSSSGWSTTGASR